MGFQFIFFRYKKLPIIVLFDVLNSPQKSASVKKTNHFTAIIWVQSQRIPAAVNDFL